MRIDAITPRDDIFHDWYATYRASSLYGLPEASPYAEGEISAWISRPNGSADVLAFGGIVDDRVVATLVVDLPLRDNTDSAFADLHVHPEERRRGYGSALLQHVEALVLSRGRRLVTIETVYPVESPHDGRGTPGADFLRTHGFEFCLGNLTRSLTLPVHPSLTARLRAECAPHHPGYSFRQYSGAAPDDLVEQVGQLIGQVAVEAPVGGLEIEAEAYDADRMRTEEQLLEAMSRRRYTTVALDPSGAVVGFSELVVAGLDEGRAYQWGTLVLPEHRGHRLGMAVKVRNLEFLESVEPGHRRLITSNAEINESMVAINERLGFRPVERMGEFQKRL